MYLVAHYLGQQRSVRNAGFHTYNDALGYLQHLASSAKGDGYRVDGDPMDGTITIFDDDGGGAGETFTVSETHDPRELKKLRPSSTGVRHPKLP